MHNHIKRKSTKTLQMITNLRNSLTIFEFNLPNLLLVCGYCGLPSHTSINDSTHREKGTRDDRMEMENLMEIGAIDGDEDGQRGTQ